MILQLTPSRLLFVFVIQPILIFAFSFVAYRILRRNRNKITLTLSLFYILTAVGFTLNVIFLLMTVTGSELLLYIIYFFSSLFVIFPPIFLVFFILHLIYRAPKISFRMQIVIIGLFGVGCFLLLLWGILLQKKGIFLNEINNWIPEFSLNFLIVMYIFFTATIFIPTIIYLIKLYKTFENKDLKRKLRYFSIGIIGILISFYGLTLYNTRFPLEDAFRAVWSVISIVVVPLSGFLIYYGIGHNL